VQLVVARIGRAHGVRGEVTIEVRTDKAEQRFFEGALLETQPSNWGPLKIASVRNHNGTLLLSFEGRDDRNSAEALRNVLLLADVEVDTDKLDEDEFHATEILGCVAVLESGQVLGKVVDILQLPSQDTLVVNRDDESSEEILIPFVRKHVPEIDLEKKRLIVRDMEGLI
jgi:16S rRNA processing protein RimM